MSIWVQHLLVGVIVLACASVVIWQSVRTLSGKRSRVGSCCAKGCGEAAKSQTPKSERVVFLPVEMLASRSKSTKR
jgi:hypothetical protein